MLSRSLSRATLRRFYSLFIKKLLAKKFEKYINLYQYYNVCMEGMWDGPRFAWKVVNLCEILFCVVKCMYGDSVFHPPMGRLHYPKTRYIEFGLNLVLCGKLCKSLWNLVSRENIVNSYEVRFHINLQLETHCLHAYVLQREIKFYMGFHVKREPSPPCLWERNEV